MSWRDDIDLACQTFVAGVQVAWGSVELNLSQHDARALAKALLAATDAAAQLR